MPDILDRLKTALSDHYSIERELGAGGMATVYLAEDLKHHRKVAVKVLRPELAAALGPDRFLREIEIAAALTHPHILPLHDSGEADGFLYYIMPYIEGETLRDRLNRETQLSVDDALLIAKNVAAALSYAHQQGVVHRDIKPENILLSAGEAVVADFGIARAISAAGGESLTKTGLAVGTPIYMSPEQASGARDLDGRSDVYALGCVLYEMLAGEPPLGGPTMQAIIARRVSETPPPIRSVRDAVPAGVEQALTKALATVPADRFATAEQFGEALRAGGSTSAAVAAPVAAGGRGRFRQGIAVAAVAVLVAGAWLGRGLVTGDRGAAGGTADRRSIAVLPFDNMSGDPDNEAFTNGIHDDILTQLTKIGALRVISRTSVREYRNTTKNMRQVGEELGVATVLEGGVQRAGDQVRINAQLIDTRTDEHLWAETYNRELTAANIFAIQSDVAHQIARALEAELSPAEREQLDAVPTDNLEAYDAYLQGNAHAALGNNEQDRRIALQYYQQAVALDPDFALAQALLSRTHSAMWWFHWDRTEARLAAAKSAVDKALALDPDLPEAHAALGYYYYWGYLDYERALAAFDAAQAGQPNNIDVVRGIGYVRRRQGRMEEALAIFEQSAQLDPRSATAALDIAETHGLMRQAAAARPYHDRSISLRPGSPESYDAEARAYLRIEGSTAGARAVLEQARRVRVEDPLITLTRVWIDVLERNYAAALGRLASTPSDAYESQFFYVPGAQLFAQIYGFMEDRELERAYYDSARTVMEVLVRDRPEDARYHSALGIAYAGLGRNEDAIREGELAVVLLPVSREAWRGAYRVEELARIYTMVGEYDQAVDRLEYLLSIPIDLSAPLLAIDPVWDPLREHPRFQLLVGSEEGGR